MSIGFPAETSGVPGDLQELIKKFLATRRKSDGGYAPITDGDMAQLDEIICELVELKCDADPDGDRPINWRLINRRTHGPMHYRPVRYDFGRHGDTLAEDELAEITESCMSNMTTAAEQLRIAVLVQGDRRRQRQKALKEAQAEIAENVRLMSGKGTDET